LRFTVRRPASAEVSPCCHRPSGGDIACGVHVSIARARIAGDALENRLALAVFRRDMPALRASLRRIRSRNKFEPPSSFVLQPGNQQSPCLAVNLTVEALFLRDVGAWTCTGTACRTGHATDIQILDSDGVEAARQMGGGLLHPITATICLAGAQPRNGQLGSCPPVRSALRPGMTLLQPAQSLRLTSTKAGGAQHFPGGQRRRHRHATINTNHGAIVGSRDRFRDGSKSDMPTPRAIQIDAVRLHRFGDVASPPEPHPPHLRDPYLPIAVADPLDVARFESDLPKSFLSSSLTPRRAAVGAVGEVAHRLREVPQRLLLHGLRSGRQPIEIGTNSSQLGTLLVVTGRLTPWLPVMLLLHGEIPHKPRMATMLSQCCRLLKAGKQPKPRHIDNIGACTDNTSKGGTGRLLLLWRKPAVSTPQIR
jgi:hypothetical protein